MKNSSSTTKSKRESLWPNFLIWVALALVLRWQVIEPRWIPSGSMLPTLQIQDRILVEKIRPKILKPQKKHLPVQSIVVFYPPKELIEAGYEAKQALIKRIVGLPGETIEIRNGYLFRNDVLVTEPWIKDRISYEMGPVVVPKDSLWVLGDNRNNSLDSHIWGPLPEENVIGTAVLRYWPMKNFGTIRFPLPKNIEQEDRTAIRSG